VAFETNRTFHERICRTAVIWAAAIGAYRRDHRSVPDPARCGIALAQLLEFHETRRGWLGVRIQNEDGEKADAAVPAAQVQIVAAG
jgi:hypothetical protein